MKVELTKTQVDWLISLLCQVEPMNNKELDKAQRVVNRLKKSKEMFI